MEKTRLLVNDMIFTKLQISANDIRHYYCNNEGKFSLVINLLHPDVFFFKIIHIYLLANQSYEHWLIDIYVWSWKKILLDVEDLLLVKT